MLTSYLYHPICFYLITTITALILCPIAAYVSNQQKKQWLQLPLLLVGLSVPSITAIAMIYGSQNALLIEDFWQRLFLFKISTAYLVIILFLMPCVILLATGLSLFFGYSPKQFSITHELSVMKGWNIFGIVIPIILAPLIEELGWRGYGVDSLGVYFNLFTTSLLFALFWALWHLPAFFVKGYYQNQLWHLGIIYVINFFVSVFALAFLMNWVYYKTDRSIPALILFHAILNLSSMLFKTEQFTKCIVTTLFCIISIIIIWWDSNFFFATTVLYQS